SQSLGNNYVGEWINPSTLVITIVDSTGATPPAVGELTLTGRVSKVTENLKNAAKTSSIYTGTSPSLKGSFTSLAGPYISELVANDPDGTNAAYSNGDTISVKFSESTNVLYTTATPQVLPSGLVILTPLLTKSQVDALFTFSQSLGNNYVGEWINPSTLVITIVDSTGATPPAVGELTLTIKASANIKNEAGTSIASTYTSPPLLGHFGGFIQTAEVADGGVASMSLPSGVVLELEPPSQESGTFEVEWTEVEPIVDDRIKTNSIFKFSPLADTVEITPTIGTPCEATGCTIEFIFTPADVGFARLGQGPIQIFHDINGDGDFIDFGEQLVTTITSPTPGIFVASATTSSFSKFAVGAMARTLLGVVTDFPPTFTGKAFSEIEYSLIIGSRGFALPLYSNTIDTSTIETGKQIQLKLLMYDSYGPSTIQHIELHTNLRGTEREITNSNTYIIYEKGKPIQISDPNAFFSTTNISTSEKNNKLELTFDITFVKPMEKSDIIIRAWDEHKNSHDTKILDAWEVIEPKTTPPDLKEEKHEEPVILSINMEPKIFDVKVQLGNGTKFSASDTKDQYVDNQSLSMYGIVDSPIPLKRAELRFIKIGDPVNDYTAMVMDVQPLQISNTTYTISATIPQRLMQGPAITYWIHVLNEATKVTDSDKYAIGVKPTYLADGKLELDIQHNRAEGITGRPIAYFTNTSDKPLYGTISLIFDGKTVHTSEPQLFQSGETTVTLVSKTPIVGKVKEYEAYAKAEFYGESIGTEKVPLYSFPATQSVSLSKPREIEIIKNADGDTVANPTILYASFRDEGMRYRVIAPDGTCVIGGSEECLVTQSTTGLQGNLKSVMLGEQVYRVRYSGPDNPLERFSITSI
ncbi:MAG: hypothetical protein ACREAE_02625, partial [Nitrosopumilaceae archaeon]